MQSRMTLWPTLMLWGLAVDSKKLECGPGDDLCWSYLFSRLWGLLGGPQVISGVTSRATMSEVDPMVP